MDCRRDENRVDKMGRRNEVKCGGKGFQESQERGPSQYIDH